MAGRPKDSFSDPALRLRNWYWLDCVAKTAKVEKPSDLDRLKLMESYLNQKAFLSVEQDGYDPDRINLTETLSLYEHIKANKRFKEASKIYKHPLWRHLQSRNPYFPEKADWLKKKFHEFGFVPVLYDDIRRIKELDLVWPEFGDAESPILDAIEQIEPDRFATLDGLLFLLLLYRDAVDSMDARQAVVIREKLEQTALTHNRQNKYEQWDTFSHLIRSRMLRWDPDIEPTQQGLDYAADYLLMVFDQTPQHKSGKKRKHPSLLATGKVERRWRRKVRMNALAHPRFRPHACIGYQRANAFNTWLQENRARIDLQLDMGRATKKKHQDPKETHDYFINRSKPLLIPVNSTHSRIPYVHKETHFLLSEPLTEYLDIELKIVPES